LAQLGGEGEGEVSEDQALVRRNELLDWMFALHQHGADVYGEEITCLNDLLTRRSGAPTPARPGGATYYEDDLATVGYCASNPYRVLNFERMSKKRLFGYSALQRIVHKAMTSSSNGALSLLPRRPSHLAPTERALWLAAYYVNHGHPFSSSQHAALPVGVMVGDNMHKEIHPGYFRHLGGLRTGMGGECMPLGGEGGVWAGSSAPIVRDGDETYFEKKPLPVDLYDADAKVEMHYNDPRLVATYKRFSTRFTRYKTTLDSDGDVAPIREDGSVYAIGEDEVGVDYRKLTCQQDDDGRQAVYKPGAWPREVVERGHAFPLHLDDANPDVKVPHMLLFTCVGSAFMNSIHELYEKYSYGDILRSRDFIFTHSDPFWLYVEPREAPLLRKYARYGDTITFVPLEREQTYSSYTYNRYGSYYSGNPLLLGQRPSIVSLRSDTRRGVEAAFRNAEVKDRFGRRVYDAVIDEGYFGPFDSEIGYFDRGVSTTVTHNGVRGNWVSWAVGPGAASDSPIVRIGGAAKAPLDEDDNVGTPAGGDRQAVQSGDTMCRNRMEIWVPVNRVSVARFMKYSTSLFNPFARATDGAGAANAARKLNPELHHTYVLMPGTFKFIKTEHTEFLGAKRHNTVVQLLADDPEVAEALS